MHICIQMFIVMYSSGHLLKTTQMSSSQFNVQCTSVEMNVCEDSEVLIYF